MGTEIPCTDRNPSPTIPTSGRKHFFRSYSSHTCWDSVFQSNHAFLSCVVHELRPADIKVVAAVGDSLTVSFLYFLISSQIYTVYQSLLKLHSHNYNTYNLNICSSK